MPYGTPQINPFTGSNQPGYLGVQTYKMQPLDWLVRLLNLGEQPMAFSREITEAVQPFKIKNVMVGEYDGTTNQ